MSETAPERPAPRGDGAGTGGPGEFLTRHLGPFPVWVWVSVVGGLLLWRHFSKASTTSSAAASSTSSTSSTAGAGTVPQFVNQTYVTAPVVQQPGPPPPTPAPTPGPQQLTRTWESLGGSTYAQVAQRLLGNTNVANLHPANKAAVNWVNGPYKKNHHAIMPKGLLFTYTEGTVTSKTPAKK